MIIEYSSLFERSYRKLPDRIKRIAEKKEEIFRKDPFHPSLKSHKLHGKFSDFYAFSLDQKYRIIFKILNKNIFRFYSAGGHDIYE
ncbi:MAG: type II toxin-antitoxin system mRNA interferase toxin, RelE/StbE family [Candidatus Paceibacterota bacterium]|jgi:addiction module RelE/StbE family toxin